MKLTADERLEYSAFANFCIAGAQIGSGVLAVLAVIGIFSNLISKPWDSLISAVTTIICSGLFFTFARVRKLQHPVNHRQTPGE